MVYFGSSISPYGVFGDNPGSPRCITFVDLESDSKLFQRIGLCDESFDSAAFCVFESTLYVFEGYTTKCKSKSIYKFDLGEKVPNLKLEKCMMMNAGSMEDVKYYPMAVPTPDGRRILVYSAEPGSNFFDFELFNPKTRRCQKLPPIVCDYDEGYIFSYTFLSKYVLLVQIMERHGQMSYVLDLDVKAANQRWEECLRFCNAPLGFHSLILGNNVCLTPREGYNIMDVGCVSEDDDDEFSMGFYLFPEISSLPGDFLSQNCSITLIKGEDENGVCEFCILHVGLEEEEDEYIPHIILDVYRCDVNVCKEEMKRINDYCNEWKRTLPGAKKINTLKFCTEKIRRDFYCIHFFSGYSVAR